MTTIPDTDQIRGANWGGSIPVVLTLAPASLGTTLMPHPIHCLLNRGTFLHVGLAPAIERLHKFAPATLSFASGTIKRQSEPEPQDTSYQDDNSREGKTGTKDSTNGTTASGSSAHDNDKDWKFPVCWIEDENTQLPLRWQLFVGVLFDMTQSSSTTNNNNNNNQPPNTVVLPWKLRLHFSQYPSSQILHLEDGQVWPTIERSFKNSLKQALFMEYNNSKVAMNMSKQIHHRLWDAIQSSNYVLYKNINIDLQASEVSVQLIPVRVFVDSKPPLQRPCRGKDTTLGALLLDWLPHLFQQTTPTDDESTIEVSSKSLRYFVAGITPPLSVPVLDLWENLCHPDHFLYITILTR